MNLTPWQLWDLTTGQPAGGARTLEAKKVLDLALSNKGGLRHPGLLHLYIHLMEMSGSPETALTVADQAWQRSRDPCTDPGSVQGSVRIN